MASFSLARSLGDAYRLSPGQPIESDRALLKAWRVISQGEMPPAVPCFNES